PKRPFRGRRSRRRGRRSRCSHALPPASSSQRREPQRTSSCVSGARSRAHDNRRAVAIRRGCRPFVRDSSQPIVSRHGPCIVASPRRQPPSKGRAMATRDLAQSVIVLTGASSGFGKGAALEFARAGAKVVLAARRDDLLDELANECSAEGGDALACPTDVSKKEQVERLCATALET